MTFLPPEGPLPELSTTRVGGGVSARLIAVAVAGLLVAVVGFTLVNRPPAPAAPSPTAPAVAVVPTPAPTPAPPRNQLEGNDGIFGWPVVAQLDNYGQPAIGGAHNYSYAAVLQITGGVIRSELAQDVPGDYQSTVVISSSEVGKVLAIEIGRQWTSSGLTIYQSYATSQVKLKPLLRSRAGLVVLLFEQVPPDSTPALPGPLASGYTFLVMGKRIGSQLSLSMEFILPSGAPLADFVGPRTPALYNRCRWDVAPLAAPPRPGTNEADCLGT